MSNFLLQRMRSSRSGRRSRITEGGLRLWTSCSECSERRVGQSGGPPGSYQVAGSNPAPVTHEEEKRNGVDLWRAGGQAGLNPSGDGTVTAIKQAYARIIDLLEQRRDEAVENDEEGRARLYSIAITEAEGAQMRAVKAATWQE